MQEDASFVGGVMESRPAAMPQGRQLARIADAIARWSIYLSALLIPLFYLPWTVDGLEFNKQALLIVLTIIGTLAWLGKMLVNRKVEFRRSIMNLLIGIYLVIYFLSAWFSSSQYVSFVGDFGQASYGGVTVVCFALLYFVAINTFRSSAHVWNTVKFLLLGGLIVLVLAYLQALGLRILPGVAAQGSAFNLLGSVNALAVYTGFMLALLMGLFITPDHGDWKLLRRALMGLLGILAVLYIAMLSFWVLWLVVVAAAVTVLAYGMVKTDRVQLVTMLSIPMALIVVGVLFMFLRFPIQLGLPSEVMPSLSASLNISKDALANTPLLGSGPGTFLYDYVQFRSPDLNATAFWNVHFDRSSSSFLTLLATTGIFGVAAFLVLFLYFGIRIGLGLAKGKEDWLLRLTLFTGWVALFVGKLFYSTNITIEFLFWLVMALLVVLEWDRWHSIEFENSPRAALLSSFCFIVAIIFSVAGLYLEGQRYAGEVYYSKAVTAQLTDESAINQSVDQLAQAIKMNGQNDLYHRTLSQALRLKVNIEVQKAGPQPSADAARRIATLTANAVNVGKRATDLNPVNVQNWSSLAGMYRDLTGIAAGAPEAAEAAYKKAIELEPNNPIYYTELGKVQLGLATALQAGLESVPESERGATQTIIDEKTADAAAHFNKAVNLKADYGPGHFWVAMMLQRQGKTDEAISRLVALRNANPNDLGVGFQLAILLYQNKDRDNAIAELERLVALSPSYSNARWYLSAMYEEAGRLDDAVAQVEEVKKYNPDDPNIQSRLDVLNAKISGEAVPAPAGEGLPEPVGPGPEGEVIPAP